MRTLLELIESRSDLDISKPWTMNASQWLIANNIHEPFIAEISPMQYAHLGKQQKAAYDAKRNKEWNDAAKGKTEWAKLVYKAFKDGKFEKDDMDVSDAARDAIRYQGVASEKEELDKIFKEEDRKNEIMDTSELKVGDVVWHFMYRQYVTVTKVGKKSVSADYVGYNGQAITNVKPRLLRWLSYEDLQKKVYGDKM